MPTLYIAVTNHGFGHATRAASIAAEIRRCCEAKGVPLTLIMATKSPKWLLDSYLKGDYLHRPVRFDVGVLQSDSLTMDKPATLAAMQRIQADQEALIAEEAAFLQSAGVDLVLADIPPLMAKIAHHAGVPCWMMGNFGWDFIYRPWVQENRAFGAIADWIGECCSHAEKTFRMPFHAPMSSMPNVIDIGLTGGTPTYGEAYLRSLMKSDTPSSHTVLLTFGGLGLSTIPYQALNQFPDWQFITFDRDAPNLPNLYRVMDQSMRPVDWMIVCDRIFSKPGYSTFAEACLLDKGVITITREGFAEAQILIDGIQDYAPHRIVDVQSFFDGDWSFLVEDL
ncbi:MAG: glycosyl transferase [Phormidesmis sp.]